jgi:hypothetical protein
MKWYRVIQNDRAVEIALVVDDEDLGGVEPDKLQCGTPVSGWSTSALLRATSSDDDGEPDDALQNHLGLLVFSARLRAGLESAGVCGFQFLPVRVERPGGDAVAGYAIANVVVRRAVLDRDRSEFDVFPPDYFLLPRRGQIRGLRAAALRRAALSGADVFDSTNIRRVYVSEKFKRVFDDGGFTGLGFSRAPVVEAGRREPLTK